MPYQLCLGHQCCVTEYIFPFKMCSLKRMIKSLNLECIYFSPCYLSYHDVETKTALMPLTLHSDMFVCFYWMYCINTITLLVIYHTTLFTSSLGFASGRVTSASALWRTGQTSWRNCTRTRSTSQLKVCCHAAKAGMCDVIRLQCNPGMM